MASFNLQLSTEELNRIVNFAGYGRPTADVWFIGFEEGLGKMSSAEARKNVKARGTFDPVMDLREAHLRLVEGGMPINIENRKSFTPVWLWMAKIMRAKLKHRDWRDKELAKDNLRTQLGRADGCTFLTELSPIPSRRATDDDWKSWFKKQDEELEDKIARRKLDLNSLRLKSSPSLIICYGFGRSKEFSELLRVEWRLISGRPRISTSSDKRFLLLPFFGNGLVSETVIEFLLLNGLLR